MATSCPKPKKGHVQLLAALIGPLPLDTAPNDYAKTSVYKQFVKELQALENLHCEGTLLEEIANAHENIYLSEQFNLDDLCSRFGYADVSELKAIAEKYALPHHALFLSKTMYSQISLLVQCMSMVSNGCAEGNFRVYEG